MDDISALDSHPNISSNWIRFDLESQQKPSLLSATHISTTRSSNGIHRKMATVSPLYQVTSAITPGVVAPLVQSHTSAINYQNTMSDSALAATRTSSFAAALRKLAKQSFDPLMASESAQHCSSLNFSGIHSTNISKNTNSHYESAIGNIGPHSQCEPFGRYLSGLVGPPIVTIAPIAAHQSIDRTNDLRKGENASFFDHRIHNDSSKESLLYSHSQRTSPIVQVRPSPSRVHNECLSSANSHTTAQNNLTNRSSGFQPYRSGFEESAGSTSGLPSAPLPSHLLPYEALGFPYHPFLSHSGGSMSASSSLTNAVPHPSAGYRLADNYYLDRFGLLRGSLHSGSGLPQPPAPTGVGNGGSSSVPFNLVRYSELLSSQTERLINDERQRLLNQSLSQNAYKVSAQAIDSPVLHVNIGANNGINTNNNSNERLIESNSEPILPMGHSVANHLSSGSIMSGTPRDMASGLPNSSRCRPSVANISAVKPLNLSSNCEQHMNSGSEQQQIYLWRPQSDDRKEQHNNCSTGSQMDGRHQSSETGAYGRRNSGFIAEDSIQTKGFRVNSFENTDPFIDSKVMANNTTTGVTKAMSLCERNSSCEGLHSRILENSLERSVANDLTLNSSLNKMRPEIEIVDNHFISESKTDTSIRREEEEEEDIESKVVSKLDLKEIKLKQKRLNKLSAERNGSVTSDEESNESEDSDYSDDNDLKYNIILSKRMPLDLDTNEDKMQFLGIFKLTTHKRKNQLEFNKYIKRRKVLRQSSPQLDPIVVESMDENNKENPELVLSASDISPDRVASEEKKMEVKVHFMSTLGLCAQTCSEKKRTVELLWTGITKERQIRSKRNKCWTKVLNNLSEDTLHKWLIGLQSNGSEFVFENRFHHSNGFIQNSLTNCKTIATNGSLDSNSSRLQRKVILFNKQTNDSKSSSLPMSNRSRIHSNKDFAQEFHESVLLETAKQQQSRHAISEQSNASTSRSGIEPSVRHCVDSSDFSSPYKWPGIEAVMEAYDRHSYDRNQEKDFLHERTHQLKSKLQDINREAEYLSQKMANLLQTKSHLDEERQHYETTLDALKTCLRQMR